MKVKIKNFQSIRQAALEFVPGLTVIVGPSNTGKSATLRAIEAALYNRLGDTFVTSGEEYSAVKIEDNNHTLIWKRMRKGETKTVMSLDGKTLIKLGRTQPDEVSSVFKIKDVAQDENKERLNFWKQMDYPFLMDRTPSQLFYFLAHSAEAEKVQEIIEEIKRDTSSAKNEMTRLMGSIDVYKETRTRCQNRIKELNPYLVHFDKAAELNQDIEIYKRLLKLDESLSSVIVELDLVTREKNAIKIPEITDAQLEGVSRMITVVEDLENRQARINQIDQELVVYRKQLEGLVVPDIDFDESLFDQLKDLERRQAELGWNNYELGELVEKKESLMQEIEMCLAEEQRLIEEIKICPLCGQPMIKETK